MTHNYILSCCSTADLSKQKMDALGLECIHFHFTIDGKSFMDDLGQTIPFDKFYKMMADGAQTSTSQINQGEYMDYFTSLLQSGKDVLHISLSTGLSGTYNSARLAAEAVRPSFPDRKLYVVDSLAASSGYGLLMDKLSELRNSGMDIDELYSWVENNKMKLHHWFFSTDLSYYVRGGRISRAEGLLGGILNICPLLNMNHLGKLTARSKIRGKKKVIPEIVERMIKYADGGTGYNGKCFISQSACLDDAKAVASLVEKAFRHLDGKVEIYDIGTTIGSHTGPGTVALFFWGSERIAPTDELKQVILRVTKQKD